MNEPLDAGPASSAGTLTALHEHVLREPVDVEGARRRNVNDSDRGMNEFAQRRREYETHELKRNVLNVIFKLVCFVVFRKRSDETHEFEGEVDVADEVHGEEPRIRDGVLFEGGDRLAVLVVN